VYALCTAGDNLRWTRFPGRTPLSVTALATQTGVLFATNSEVLPLRASVCGPAKGDWEPITGDLPRHTTILSLSASRDLLGRHIHRFVATMPERKARSSGSAKSRAGSHQRTT
jgi:hypothetical protein